MFDLLYQDSDRKATTRSLDNDKNPGAVQGENDENGMSLLSTKVDRFIRIREAVIE